MFKVYKIVGYDISDYSVNMVYNLILAIVRNNNLNIIVNEPIIESNIKEPTFWLTFNYDNIYLDILDKNAIIEYDREVTHAELLIYINEYL